MTPLNEIEVFVSKRKGFEHGQWRVTMRDSQKAFDVGEDNQQHGSAL